jgi:hypothetical protein
MQAGVMQTAPAEEKQTCCFAFRAYVITVITVVHACSINACEQVQKAVCVMKFEPRKRYLGIVAHFTSKDILDQLSIPKVY